MNPTRYLIRSADGRFWQTARGFLPNKDPRDATLYDSRDEATKVRNFCAPRRARATVEEAKALGGTTP